MRFYAVGCITLSVISIVYAMENQAVLRGHQSPNAVAAVQDSAEVVSSSYRKAIKKSRRKRTERGKVRDMSIAAIVKEETRQTEEIPKAEVSSTSVPRGILVNESLKKGVIATCLLAVALSYFYRQEIFGFERGNEIMPEPLEVDLWTKKRSINLTNLYRQYIGTEESQTNVISEIEGRDDVADFIRSHFNQLNNLIQTVASESSKTAGDAKNNFARFLSAANDAITQYFDEGMQQAGRMVSGVSETAADTKNNIARSIAYAKNGLAQYADEGKQRAERMVSEFSKTAEDSKNNIVNSVSSASYGIAQYADERMQRAGRMVSEFSKTAEDAKNNIANSVSSATNGISQYADEGMQRAGRMVSEFSKTAEDAKNNIANSVSSATNGIAKYADEGMQRAGRMVSELSKTAGDAINIIARPDASAEREIAQLRASAGDDFWTKKHSINLSKLYLDLFGTKTLDSGSIPDGNVSNLRDASKSAIYGKGEKEGFARFFFNGLTDSRALKPGKYLEMLPEVTPSGGLNLGDSSPLEAYNASHL